MPSLTLLGPQRFTPTLGDAVARAGVAGQLASVTAGWQEREAEDLELHEHLGERTQNLMLYARSEDVFERDPELETAYRERQERLREMQAIYRGRLAHALAALREIENRPPDPELLDPEVDSALVALRALDEHHVRRIAAVHDEFDERYAPAKRATVARHARQIDRVLDRTEGVAIAGGHVAILLNRMRLFDFGRKLADRAIFAWSAGAMAISERVVVFHHFPPQGQGITEVLEAGLGLARGIVPLPHAHRRLALDAPRRLSRLSRRFLPAVCIAMDDGGCLEREAGELEWRSMGGMNRILPDGSLDPMGEGHGA